MTMALRTHIESSLIEKFKKSDNSINYSSSAKAIGVSRQTIMGWINQNVNVYDMKLDNLIKLSKATGRPVAWFLEDVDSPKGKTGHILTGESVSLINLIQESDLTPKSAELIAELIKQLSPAKS